MPKDDNDNNHTVRYEPYSDDTNDYKSDFISIKHYFLDLLHERDRRYNERMNSIEQRLDEATRATKEALSTSLENTRQALVVATENTKDALSRANENIKSALSAIDSRFQAEDSRLSALEKRFEQVNEHRAKIERLEGQLYQSAGEAVGEKTNRQFMITIAAVVTSIISSAIVLVQHIMTLK